MLGDIYKFANGQFYPIAFIIELWLSHRMDPIFKKIKNKVNGFQ